MSNKVKTKRTRVTKQAIERERQRILAEQVEKKLRAPQQKPGSSPETNKRAGRKMEVKKTRNKLSNYEKETIINFNEGEPMANIFTYNKVWQKHLEKRLGLKPVIDNGYGGKEYEISKKRIKPPRAPLKLSSEARAKIRERLKKNQKKRHRNTKALAKSDAKKKNLTNTINRQLSFPKNPILHEKEARNV